MKNSKVAMIDSEERRREQVRRRNREITAATQEIAPIPAIVDKKRRKKAEKSFKYFCETYFPDVFFLGWSDIHLQVIQKIERVVNNGEIFTLAMPRASGKTTLLLIACIWAAFYGKTEFVVLIASNSDRAKSLLEDIKIWIETNDLLFEDFPEICHPVRKLERIAQRQRGQTYDGEPTRINWKADMLVFPTIKGSPSSGVCLTTAGMNGADIRGLSHTRPDGRRVRPSLAFIDDPQTRESAQSPSQCDTRERIIKSDILGMAGPGKKLALLIACTVIAEDDLAQRLLDKNRNPEFRGERYQLLEKEPENQALWDEYRQIRDTELQNDGDGSQATAFYKENQKAMDKGAVPSWKERYNDDEISAIQHAMNLKMRDYAAYLSEYQNMPTRDDDGGDYFEPTSIYDCVSGFDRGHIPDKYEFLTGFVDVHKNLLYWSLCAWTSDFEGVVVDYDVFPKQRRTFFQLADASPTLMTVSGESVLETAIYKGLQEVMDTLFGTLYLREDGTDIYIRRVMIDASWGPQTDTIYQYINESPYKQHLSPSFGQYLGATSRPYSEIRIASGDKAGVHWRIPKDTNGRPVKRVLIDTNYWKTFVLSRLMTKAGDTGRLVINGAPQTHKLLVTHLSSEYCLQVEARGRRVDEWKLRPNEPDNHWFDCFVGSAVAASISGAKLPEGHSINLTRGKRAVSFDKIKKFAKTKE